MNVSQPLDVTLENRPRIKVVYALAVILVVGIVAFLLFYRLDEYPAAWYDEGSHLHVAKNYALNGIYADFSSEGIRYYGPAIGVGPTVLLPISALYRVFGVSIPLARVVIVVYSVFALGMLYALSQLFVGRLGALIAVILVIVSPSSEFIYNSRTVLGEVPGLFFLVTAFWLWFKASTRPLPTLLGVGLFFGLACITKNQYALIILPSLLLSWITDLVWYRQQRWWYFVIPGIIAGVIFFAWTFVVLVVLGSQGDIAANLATMRKATSGAFLSFNLATLDDATGVLLAGTTYGSMFIPALLYGLFLSRKRDHEGQKYGILCLFILVATVLFVTSLGWARYAFAPIVLVALLVTRLFQDLIGDFATNFQNLRARLAGQKVALNTVVLILVIGWALGSMALPFAKQIRSVLMDGNTNVNTLAEYLNQNVSQAALIETWEQELAVLTAHRYHYPPQIVLAYSVEELEHNGPPARDLYNFLDYGPADYLITGPFSKYTNIYPFDRLDDYQLIHTVGAYDVYQRID